MSILVALVQEARLETDRLLLRPMTIEDLDDYYKVISDDENLKYAFFPATTKAQALEELVLYNLKEPLGRYGIEEKISGRLIGNIAFKILDDETSLEVGYTLAKDVAGQGYATEAVLALRDLASRLTTIKSLKANTDYQNIASQRVLEKSGFVCVAEKPAISLRGQERFCRYYELVFDRRF